MSTPEQEKALSTIGALAASLRNQKLSDVQIDLLEVAAHLMTNIAVQTTLNCATTRLVELEYTPGEPVDVDLAAIELDGQSLTGWQRTTVINRQQTNENEVMQNLEEPQYRYQTAATGRGIWVAAAVLRKVEAK